MTNLHDILAAVRNRSVPGAVGLVAHGGRIEVAAVGQADAAGTTPMTRESVFRIASITKPITAVAVLMLVEDGRIALDGPVDDVVPAARPITVEDLLTFRAGYGFPSDFSLPAVAPLFTELRQGPPQPQAVADPDAWMATLSRIPMLHQPGDAWLYNTCSDIQGVLIAQASGQPLAEFLAERLFEPLGMADTGFVVPPGALDRFTAYYRPGQDGEWELIDAPDGQWSTLPVFPSGASGLVSTADDWFAFGRMLLGEGAVGDRRVLSPASVWLLTTDHLTAPQRAASTLFLEGQGWGFGGSVDVCPRDPWHVPGRYGWVGGTGTAAHVTPSTGAATILLTQVEMSGPTPTPLMRDFWRYAG